ncbi:MAG: hypothetical protein IKV94_05580 [Clostridia bacterium]|nr:hypothetical protein [Clostridia bacterium]
MSDKFKNIIITVSFMACVVGGFLINIIIKDEKISESERRKLTQFPNASLASIMDGNFMTNFNDYSVDQFILRDEFRSLKSLIEFNILGKKDNNNLYIVNDAIYKMEENFNYNEIKKAADKFNKIYEEYLTGMNVYYSLIPEKTYYLSDKGIYTSIDYDKIADIMNSNIKNMKYIDIYDCLNEDSYYRTDTHWKQEALAAVVNKISENMNFKEYLKSNYTTKTIDDFYGVYYGQLALSLLPDKITYYTNSVIDESAVYNYETQKYAEVYDLTKLSSMDKYDMFLSGATPLLRIENPNCTTGKKLIVFRDSYASSLIPFFVEAYEEIMVIDIRYMPSSMLKDYIEFSNQDVLFLYSTLVLGNSSILR